MKVTAIVSIITISVAGFLILLQMWFNFLAPGIFLKVLITLGAFLFVFVIASLIRREYIEELKMKDDGFLD